MRHSTLLAGLGPFAKLNHKTIRYPGHAVIMRGLLNDLHLRDRRSVLKDLPEHAVPTTLQDVVIIFVTVSGRKNGELIQETYASKIYSRDMDGRTLSAIQITTAAAMCTVLDLLSAGVLPQHGFIRQEDISLNAFLESRFGQAYAKPGPGPDPFRLHRMMTWKQPMRELTLGMVDQLLEPGGSPVDDSHAMTPLM
jgi:saccharopine dehydrogenase-like NADP-dependent oxidoreductase